LQSGEVVTVIDPRDPLYRQTFTLLFVENKSYRGKCCVVRMETGIERHIPISVTDQAMDPICSYPLPLNLSSVRELLVLYARMICQIAERTEDGYPDQNFSSFSSQGINPTPDDPIARTLGISGAGTTAKSNAGNGKHLPSDRSAAGHGAGGAE
jgi:hypothetical protein